MKEEDTSTWDTTRKRKRVSTRETEFRSTHSQVTFTNGTNLGLQNGINYGHIEAHFHGDSASHPALEKLNLLLEQQKGREDSQSQQIEYMLGQFASLQKRMLEHMSSDQSVLLDQRELLRTNTHVVDSGKETLERVSKPTESDNSRAEVRRLQTQNETLKRDIEKLQALIQMTSARSHASTSIPPCPGNCYPLRLLDSFESWAMGGRGIHEKLVRPAWKGTGNLLLLMTGSSEYIQVNATRRSTSVRCQEFSRRCRVDYSLLMQIPQVPYLALAEKLLLKELEPNRVPDYDCGCHCVHYQRFRLEQLTGIKVACAVVEWARKIEQRKYHYTKHP